MFCIYFSADTHCVYHISFTLTLEATFFSFLFTYFFCSCLWLLYTTSLLCFRVVPSHAADSESTFQSASGCACAPSVSSDAGDSDTCCWNTSGCGCAPRISQRSGRMVQSPRPATALHGGTSLKGSATNSFGPGFSGCAGRPVHRRCCRTLSEASPSAAASRLPQRQRRRGWRPLCSASAPGATSSSASCGCAGLYWKIPCACALCGCATPPSRTCDTSATLRVRFPSCTRCFATVYCSATLCGCAHGYSTVLDPCRRHGWASFTVHHRRLSPRCGCARTSSGPASNLCDAP